MTHEELARLSENKNYAALYPFAAVHAKYAVLALMDEEPDDDTMSEAAVAYIEAVQDWQPLENAFSTHINMRVQGRIREYLREVQTGGIGSRWTVSEGEGAAEHQTLAKPIGENVEEEDDPPTWLNNLTYDATGSTPAGYGDIGLELQDQHIDEEIAYRLHGLDPREVDALRKVIMEEVSVRDYAEILGENYRAVHRRVTRALDLVSQNAKTCLMECKAVADWKGLQSHFKAARRFPGFWNGMIAEIQSNPIWSQVTGKVYNDWAWRPDIMAEASFKRWSLGVSKRRRAAVKLVEAA